jgi:hypothetical protein
VNKRDALRQIAIENDIHAEAFTVMSGGYAHGQNPRGWDGTSGDIFNDLTIS